MTGTHAISRNGRPGPGRPVTGDRDQRVDRVPRVADEQRNERGRAQRKANVSLRTSKGAPMCCEDFDV